MIPTLSVLVSRSVVRAAEGSIEQHNINIRIAPVLLEMNRELDVFSTISETVHLLEYLIRKLKAATVKAPTHSLCDHDNCCNH